MIFIAKIGEKSSLIISEVRSDLTNEDVVTLMHVIISNNIFSTSKGDLVSKHSAQVVQRDVTKLEI